MTDPEELAREGRGRLDPIPPTLETTVTAFGELLRKIPPIRTAVGFMVLVMTAAFSIGAASVRLKDIPARLSAVEVSQNDMKESNDSLAVQLTRHIVQDSLATWRIYCVVNALAHGEVPGPLDCDPTTAGRSQ